MSKWIGAIALITGIVLVIMGGIQVVGVSATKQALGDIGFGSLQITGAQGVDGAGFPTFYSTGLTTIHVYIDLFEDDAHELRGGTPAPVVPDITVLLDVSELLTVRGV